MERQAGQIAVTIQSRTWNSGLLTAIGRRGVLPLRCAPQMRTAWPIERST